MYFEGVVIFSPSLANKACPCCIALIASPQLRLVPASMQGLQACLPSQVKREEEGGRGSYTFLQFLTLPQRPKWVAKHSIGNTIFFWNWYKKRKLGTGKLKALEIYSCSGTKCPFGLVSRFLHVCLMIICGKVMFIGLLSLMSNIRIYNFLYK